jgi:hypothetical protein
LIRLAVEGSLLDAYSQPFHILVELLLDDVGSIQQQLRPSILREDQLTMETKLKQIAVKAVNQAWCGKSARHDLWEPRRATASGDLVALNNERPYRDSSGLL